MIKKLFLILLLVLSFTLVSCTLTFVTDGNKEQGEDPAGEENKEPDPEIENKEEPKVEDKEDTPESPILTIIEANDIHGFIMQDEDHYYGLSNMAYLVNEVKAEVGADNVLMIANGDMLQGTGISRMSMGQVVLDAFGEMGLDAMNLGNHEFDWDLPTIYNFFDGNQENGEAKFPLINGNITKKGESKLYLEENVFESYIFKKAGLNVGFIGYVGDVASSISDFIANRYTFLTDFTSLTKRIGTKLKEAGADIIVVSIHDGNSDGINKFEVNNQLAQLKDDNGNYLVDAIINGHTHTLQSGYILRDGGTKVPVIQANGYASNYIYSFGRIDLTIENKKVVDASTSHLKASQAKGNYDQNVEDIIQTYYERDKEYLTSTYTNATNRISRYGDDTYKWVASVMLKATGADLAICNTGGIRADIPAGKVNFDAVYQMNPFDNHIIIHEIDAATVQKKIIDYGGYIYGYRNGVTSKSGKIKVATIDYVYYKSYYPHASKIYTTDFVLRDILIEDLRLRGSTFNIKTDYEAVIPLKVTNVTYSFTYYVLDDKQNWMFI